jgi:NAD(P)-dependent dehydrogenase (short-subunit alcohol dehydrogenase family)
MTHSEMLGKVVVITGAAQGIGLATAARFNSYGAQIFVLDKKSEGADAVGEHVRCDVGDENSVISAFSFIGSRCGSIDILCANAGIVPTWKAIQDVDLETWNRVMAINATGLMLTIKHGSRLFSSGLGSIVVTGSMNSWKGDPNIASYVASKHAALGIIRSAALDLGRYGIRVNGVAPGPIATTALIERITSRSNETGLSLDAALAEMAKATALGRLAVVEEVVNTIEFLASEWSSGITGQLIHVDGGVI